MTLSTLRIRNDQDYVFVVLNKRAAFRLFWTATLDLADAILVYQKNEYKSCFGHKEVFRSTKLLVVDGSPGLMFFSLPHKKLVLSVPELKVDNFRNGLVISARAAEHWWRLNDSKEREVLYQDQAILIGAGLPINLGVPDPELRTMGANCPELVGKPKVILSPPPPLIVKEFNDGIRING